MVNRMQFYIDGAWVDPVVKKSTPVINPATEDALYEVALGSKADLDKAVAAAKRAFVTYSQTSREERIALLERIIEIYKGRMKEIGAAVSDEMGAPLPMAERLQAGTLRVVDVRPGEERALASIAGTVLTFDSGLEPIEALPKDTALAFLCHHGNRSQQAAEHFRQKGFREVYNVAGGIDAWANIDTTIPKY